MFPLRSILILPFFSNTFEFTMQDIITFAEKNNVQLLDYGNCQFCGAICSKGVFECVNNYSKVLEMLDNHLILEHFSRFMSIDAHALQHSEIHGRWSNHFHLTRLYLVLQRKIVWNYKMSPLLSTHLNRYKVNNADEFLDSPPVDFRGNIASSEILTIETIQGCFDFVKNWGESVYSAWSKHHSVVKKIGDSFIEKRNLAN